MFVGTEENEKQSCCFLKNQRAIIVFSIYACLCKKITQFIEKNLLKKKQKFKIEQNKIFTLSKKIHHLPYTYLKLSSKKIQL